MLWAVIMAGGSGTRFWPASRRHKPKQFLSLFGKKTLLQEAVLRLQGLIPASRIFVVTQQENVGRVRRQVPLPASQTIGEPLGRNTAPCAALAAQLILRKDPKAVLAILPSDHHIGNVPLYRRALKTAAGAAFETSLPITFGMKPTFPHTGYGYLEIAKTKRGQTPCKTNVTFDRSLTPYIPYIVKCFHEKPNLAKAKKFLKAGRFFWNSGIFIWRADALLKETQRLLPQLYQGLKQLKVPGTLRGRHHQLERFYRKAPNISIDYGLMEKMRGRILAILADFEWSDLGGWQVFDQFWPKDREQNATFGKTLLVDSSGNIVKSDGRLVAMVGVHDHVVVETPDAVLVCPRHKTEAVRKIVEKLKEKNWKQYL